MERNRLILPDSSAWIEYLRATASPIDLRLDALLRRGRVATTDHVIAEVLAGARSNRDRDRLKAMLYACVYIRTLSPADFETTAEIFRACRREGRTIRRLSDCVIAAVAMRAGAAVLHCDGDFDAIALHLPLDIDAVRPDGRPD